MHTPIDVTVLADYPAHIVLQAISTGACTMDGLQERMRRRGIYHTAYVLGKRLVHTLKEEGLITVEAGVIDITQVGSDTLENLNADSEELAKIVAAKRKAEPLFDDEGKRNNYDGAELRRQPGIPDERYAAFDLPSVQGRWRVWPRNSRPPELVNPDAVQQDAGELLAGGV